MRLARESGWKSVVAAVLLVGSTAFAQTGVKAPVTAAGTVPVFEVSTVRRNVSGSGSSESSFENGRFVASNVQIKNLMQYSAYGVPGPRIFGGPKWMESERFDIEAKLDHESTERLYALGRAERKIATQAMFQRLLADRFHLAVHWETRELPVYALIVGKKGSLLRAWNGSGGTGTSANNGQLTAHGITSAELARALTQELAGELGRVVVDRTGLTGQYDVSLKWTPEASLMDAGSAAGAPSIFTAVQEQLGLRLESSRGPVEVLVIDRAELPTEE